jgi:hypothetical protein
MRQVVDTIWVKALVGCASDQGFMRLGNVKSHVASEENIIPLLDSPLDVRGSEVETGLADGLVNAGSDDGGVRLEPISAEGKGNGALRAVQSKGSRDLVKGHATGMGRGLDKIQQLANLFLGQSWCGSGADGKYWIWASVGQILDHLLVLQNYCGQTGRIPGQMKERRVDLVELLDLSLVYPLAIVKLLSDGGITLRREQTGTACAASSS